MATRTLLVIIIGVIFEHFDMMLAGLLSTSIIKEFVSPTTHNVNLLYGYLGYAIAFLFRPLGAFVFGLIGDLYGRKKALIGSMFLMSLATLSIGILPGAKVLGFWAIGLFFLCRVAQGLSVGGEYGTAMTYAFELKTKFKLFCGTLIVSSTHVGGVIASVLASLYVDDFRKVFLIGGCAGFFLLLLRTLMNESYKSSQHKAVEIAKSSLKHKTSIVEALLVASHLVLVFYGSLIYLNEFIYQNMGIDRSQLFKANTFLLALWVFIPPFFGFVADKRSIPYRKMMIMGVLGVFLSSPFLGLSLVSSNYSLVLIAQITLHLFHMLFCLCTPQFYGELFEIKVRNTAISTSYSLGSSITAALAPMICHLSISVFHTSIAVSLPFMVSALILIFIFSKEELCKKTTLLSSMT